MATLSQTILSDQREKAEMLILNKQVCILLLLIIVVICAVQLQRTSERTSLVDDAMFRTHENMNHERHTETTCPQCLLRDTGVTKGEAVVREAVNPEIVQQFEQARTLYNRFYKGTPKEINSRGYRIPFYDRPPASDAFSTEGGAFASPDNPQFSDMKIFPARYNTAFRISGDTFDNISGDALIDKISDIFLLQTEAAKKTLDFQVAGSRTGSIGTVLTATTGANGTITFTTTVAAGDTWGSYKVKDGARLNIINGTTNAVRGAVAIVVDPGGRYNCLLHS